MQGNDTGRGVFQGEMKSALFSLLARVDHIGPVDQATGKSELRFFINDIEKMVSSCEESRHVL
jgi:hypothetical protein